MADKNQLKIADQVDLADDDPFAELTRIMGFDPRQPARQAPAAPAAETAPDEPTIEEDDFSLDLEKELLGSFDLEDEQASAQSEPVAESVIGQPEPEGPEATEPEHAEVDFDFSDAFDAAMAAPDGGEHVDVPVQQAADQQAPDQPESAVASSAFESEAPEIDLDFSNAFDAAMAAPEAFDVPEKAGQEPAFDGDLDAAFAAAGDDATAANEEAVFDLDLTEEDIHGLEESSPAPALPVTPQAVAGDAAMEDDLDAAMADFMVDEAASQPVAAADPEGTHIDPDLFDENDFVEEESVSVTAAEPDSEMLPEAPAETEVASEFDDSAFRFDDEEFRLDDAHAVEDQPPADEVSFDHVDFGSEDEDAGDLAQDRASPEAPAEDALAAAEPDLTETQDRLAASDFESSAPSYAPRKLPISPMDVAAEEFRQREAAAAPAGPGFNLEDELNALLGNVKSGQQPAEAAASMDDAADEAQSYEAQSYEAPAYETPSFVPQPSPSGIFGSVGPAAYEENRYDASEPAGFDAPEHPADIGDDLKWELDEAFANEAENEQIEEEPATYENNRFDPQDPETAYAQNVDVWEEPAPIDLDDGYDESSEASSPYQAAPPYGDAIAGAAAGAAASHFGAGFASHAFDTGERFSQPRQAAARNDAAHGSPHRDPVVRGNPLKEDPLDIITQLAEKYSRKEPATPYGRAMSVAAGTAPAGYSQLPEDQTDGDIDISDAFEEPPEVETVEVGDQPVALADDLEIPELPEEEDLPPVSAYDDLDAEFSSLLNEMNAEQKDAKPASNDDDPLVGGFGARPYESNAAAASYGARPAPAKAYDDIDDDQESFAFDADDLAGGRIYSGSQYAADDYQYDPDVDQEIAAQHHLAAEGRRPRSRGLLVAGVVGGVALVGAIGAFALSFGGGGEDAPAIVRADEDPVKVRPENPGGATVPNQDSKVYETVAGEGAATDAPQQEKLVTTTEEPVDVMPPAVEDEDVATASGKSEDRIEQILQEAENQTDAEIVAVAPRKVRTLVVKPDGTLVPREDEPEAASGEQTETVTAAMPQAAPAPAIPEPVAPESTMPEPTAPESTGALPAANVPPASEETLAAAASAAQDAGEEVGSEDAGTMPDTVPIAPLRPADQPIDVVGEVKPDQVAAATATAAASAGWAMQIASQPSEEAAQSSYQNLARRYGAVLEGREVNIVKAEIPGKGTFWRVRVPANSRNEAIGLCENYKAAGGNCFVSR